MKHAGLMTLRQGWLVCLVSLVVALWVPVVSAQTFGPEEWRFIYAPFARAWQNPTPELQHAKQMGYRYVSLGEPTGVMTGLKDLPAAAGMRLVWGEPESHAGASGTSFPNLGFHQRINLSNPPTGADRAFIEKYACWKSTDAWPNNIATAWWTSPTQFAMNPDFQQQEVINDVIAAVMAGYANSQNVSADFRFSGVAYDAQGGVDGQIFFTQPNTFPAPISAQTGTPSCVNHPSPYGAFEYATYSDGIAAYHKQMWAAMRAAYPNSHIYFEPYGIYEGFISTIQGRADAQELLPADMMVIQENPGFAFVDDSRIFILGLTKDRVGVSDPDTCDEAGLRNYIGKAATNGAWMTWFLMYARGINCTDYFSVDQVPARMQLARVISGWDNLMSVPLASRSWNGSVYRSPNSYVSANVLASRHPVTRKLFTVFHNKTEGIPIGSTETIANAMCTSNLFIETTNCSSHVTVTNSMLTMTASGTVGAGYIITLTTATSGMPPAAPTALRVQ